MPEPADIPTLRARLADAQAALAALRDASASNADHAQRIATLRAEIAALVAELRACGVAVDDEEPAAQRTVMTDGGYYVEGDHHQHGVFIGGGNVQGSVIGVQQGGTIVIQSPQPALSPQEQRLRAQMLSKVRATWMPLLDDTLHDVVRMDLGLAANAALVDGPRKRLRQPGQAERALPPGTPIHAVFDALAGELLILGDPGSGKTTLLLELARTLLDRADRDPAHPIPVIFTLSTWAAQRAPIAEWLVDELSKRYDVPRKLGQPWVEAGALLPLLDGLDEVAADQRAACVAAINEYHRTHGPLPLVVCSRSADYAALAVQLQLQGAVVIQPLGMDQIDAALARAGDRLESVRLAIRDDADLQALATTPLLLSVMIAAYAGRDLLAPGGFATLDARRADLFAAYIDAMFARRGADPRYPRAHTLHYLAWIARNMVQRSQTVFYIEQLQPTWLSHQQRRIYQAGIILIPSMIGGPLFQLIGTLMGSLPSRWTNRFGDSLFFILIGGLLFGLVGGLLPYKREISCIEALRWSWSYKLLRLGVGIGASVGLVSGLGGGLLYAIAQGLGGWLGGGLLFGLIVGLIGGLSVGLIGGLSGVEITSKATPNQGIRRSLQNALVWGSGGGLVFTLVIKLVVGLSIRLVMGLLFGSDDTLISRLVIGLQEGLSIALGIGPGAGAGFGLNATVGIALVVGLVFGLRYGGLACIQHLVLRILLWHSGDAPWNYAAFLDSCADRILLRKVGGGYIFLHRMLMEYFAALEDDAEA